MNIDEMIAVLQAYKDGKELEWSCNVDNKDWVTFNGHNVFNFCSFVYRVKPEPREFWLALNLADRPVGTKLNRFDDLPSGMTQIKVREVIE